MTIEATEPSDAVADAPQPFDGFIAGVAPDLLSYFRRRVHPPEDAADCLSETLIVLWRRQEALPREAGERRAYAFGIAHRVLSQHRRSGSRRIALTERLRDHLMTTTQAGPESEDTAAIDALTQLSDNDRELVTMVVWDGLTVTEAGQVLGIRDDAARARYSRARARLRYKLERTSWDG